MQGLVGTAAKAEAERLAGVHDVSWQYIYRMTADLRQGKRKQRADAGRRTFDLVEGTDVWTAAQLVIVDRLDPVEALATVRLRVPDAKLPSLEYFRQMLAARGLGKQQRRLAKRPFRRWEAEYPGELFQIDVTALKVRWRDEKTRRIMQIEGVDKNHPQMDETKLRVWQIMLVDDHSRRRYLRYFVGRAITSTEMVRFECEAFAELGVPQRLYTDQGGEFKGRHRHAEKILNKLQTIAETGGYRHIAHAPHNAQATGKVENAHKWAEKMDRLVGLADTEGQVVTIDTLNQFATRVCDYYNNHHVHRATGQTPMARWHGRRVVVRTLPREIIESALLADEFTVRLDESMTVTRNGISYMVPRALPFVDYAGKKVRVVIPPNIDWILLTLPNAAGKFEPQNGGEFEIEKIVATADKAGDFRSVAESTAEDITKRLRTTRKEEVRAIKAKRNLTGEIQPVPHYNVPVEMPMTNVTHFPQAERTVSAEEIAAAASLPVGTLPVGTQAPLPANAAQQRNAAYTGKDITYWQAVAEYQDRFEGGKAEAKQFLLDLFPGTAGAIPAAVVESAIDTRFDDRRTGLRAVS